MDDLDMNDIANLARSLPLATVMDDLDMNDIGNDHYDEENHQFSYGDSEILHNDENQSEIQVQSDNVAAQYGSCKQFIGADGSFFWIPEVEASWIPPMGSIFKDIKDAIKWYKGYVLRSGFDIRKSIERKKSGITTLKYFICNRGGLPNTSTLDTISDDHNKQLRNSNCKRTNCKAFVVFKVIPHSSEVYLWRFEQQHNHELIYQDCMHLSRAKHQLDIVDQTFIHKLSSAKKSVTSGVVSDICIVKHKRTNLSKKKVVVEKKEKVDIDCEWNFNTSEGDFEIRSNGEMFMHAFERFGIFCRHIFCILKIYDIQEIPSRYILKRWRRDIISTTILKRTFRYGDSFGNVEKVAYKAFSMLDQCLSSLSNDDKKLEEFMQKIEGFMTDIGEQGSDESPITKEAHIDKIYGATTNPEVVDVENPPMVKNKGSGTGKRLKSVLEKATIQGNKKSRSCKTCGVKGHNSRKCLTLLNNSKVQSA
ncbi:unnamed protein product [Lactuca virosa]|uniref:FAR1 domain-containing protein n=1 Tax=Lactuca virosa TaxID=75947 RepID=A0AAU9NEP8_9ASTR|nr:unnamed protein product [Lactuca virosa]